MELRDKRGILFQNDKEGVESRPDYRGETNFNGEIYRISGWKNQGTKGPYLTLEFTKKITVPLDDIPF